MLGIGNARLFVEIFITVFLRPQVLSPFTEAVEAVKGLPLTVMPILSKEACMLACTRAGSAPHVLSMKSRSKPLRCVEVSQKPREPVILLLEVILPAKLSYGMYSESVPVPDWPTLGSDATRTSGEFPAGTGFCSESCCTARSKGSATVGFIPVRGDADA